MAFTEDGNFTWSTAPTFRFVKGVKTNNGKFNDPTYLGFVFLFDFATPGASPLLVEDEEQVGTAANYLARIGELERLNYLKQFIRQLRNININMPWYWQSLEGGNSLWDYKKLQDPYRGGEDSKITIQCLESIDLRVTMLMDLYRKACFDFTHRREIVPENLRRFRVLIFIQEIRKFQIKAIGDKSNNVIVAAGTSENSGQTATSEQAADVKSVSNENSAYLLFQLDQCEFDPDISSSMLSTVTMNDPQIAAQQIAFTFENIKEPGSVYPLSTIAVGNQSGGIGKKEGSGGGIGQIGGNQFGEQEDRFTEQLASNPFTELPPSNELIQRAGSNIVEAGREIARSQLNSLILGNVYGISPTTAAAALQQASIQSLGPDLINQVLQETGKQGIPRTLGRAFDEIVNPPPTTNLGGFFRGNPRRSPPLTGSERVFE